MTTDRAQANYYQQDKGPCARCNRLWGEHPHMWYRASNPNACPICAALAAGRAPCTCPPSVDDLPGTHLPGCPSVARQLERDSHNPLQDDGESLDLRAKDYDLLERMHKQEPWTDDQQRHFAAGWEAAVTYYRSHLLP